MPKLLLSNNEKDPPSWSSFNIVPKAPDNLDETKSINVRKERIPDPTTSETKWIELNEEENIPTDKVEELYNINPR